MDIAVQSQAGQAVAGASASASVFINVLSSALNNSSPQGAFASINQIQLFMLLTLFGVYLHTKVLSYLKSMSSALISFDVTSYSVFNFMAPLLDGFNFEQPNPYLKFIGIQSGSTFINIFATIGTLFLFIGLHMIIL